MKDGGGRPLHALVLAAGRGSRFGGRKLLAPYGTGVLVEAALGAALAAPVEGVTLVVGCDADAVAARAAAFSDRVRIVEAPDWSDGMSASLRRGVAALPPETDAAFVLLGDMPRVPPATLRKLAAARAAGALAAVPVFGGMRGHPPLIGRELFGEIAALTGDRGARPVLDAHADRVVEVEAEHDGVLFDVDTPGDLTPGS
jgi:molybdenum cofactor cytidylyltransferase